MTDPPLRLLVLIDLIQDMDVLLPVLRAAREEPRIRLRVAVSRWLARTAPRIPRLLRACRIPFGYVDRPHLLSGRKPALAGIDALLTASESTAGPHRWGHALTRRARTAGIMTFTLQHGLDNLRVLGAPGPDRKEIASDVFFAWPPEAALPSDLDPSFGRKLVCVGRTTTPSPPLEPRYDVGVFENLHAAPYSDEQRQVTLEAILALARARPQARICVRTHPAGAWLDQHAGLFGALPNVTYIPAAQARRETGPAAAAVSEAARVITTPSTIALDAAACGRPVALALGGDPLYRPLPVLDGPEAWAAFADGAAAGQAEADFLARHVMAGDAAGRVVAQLTTRWGMAVRTSNYSLERRS